MQQITFPITPHTREAFSLIELLLVIFIISLVYFLGFDALESPKKNTPTLTPKTLKTEIAKYKQFRGKGTLLCTQLCSKCYFRTDTSMPFEPFEGKTAFKDMKVYTLDKDKTLVQPEYGRFRDKKICMIIDFYPNGSSTKLILETDKGIFLLPSYLGEVTQFDTLDKAQNAWMGAVPALSNEGDFY